MKRQLWWPISTIVSFSFMLTLVACDYWPPTLQAEIEQLRSETQTLTIEKTQLQAQLEELSKIKQELQSQIDELSRISREKTSVITSLQNQLLNVTRAKTLKKGMAPKVPPHKPNKPTVKPTAKAGTRPASPNNSNPPTNKRLAPHATGIRQQLSILR
jgi:peptidoglycan hydrolase CwlO-like protein